MDRFHRKRDLLLPADLEYLDVDLIGAGTLGGAILICLGKMGFGIRNRITVTDFDQCKEHNLATQWFRPFDVELRRPKVDALAEMAAWVIDCEIDTVHARFTGAEDRRLGPIVILAVDSLEERKLIWRQLATRNDVRFLVDARAGAEVVEIHALDLEKDPHGEYEASLEGDAFEEPCTRRAISYTAFGAASFVGSVLRAWVRGEEYRRRFTFDFQNFWSERQPGEPPAADAHGTTR